jgi:dUTP pyrophosphatase
VTPTIVFSRTGAVEVPLPAYETEGAAGMDLRAALPGPIVIEVRERRLISTGLRIAIPRGYEAQVRPRSGLALKHGITVLNSPGTIDSDYRGEMLVLLVNLGSEPFRLEPLDRIAQLVVAPVAHVTVQLAENLDATARGEGGYGSTGVR